MKVEGGNVDFFPFINLLPLVPGPWNSFSWDFFPERFFLGLGSCLSQSHRLLDSHRREGFVAPDLSAKLKPFDLSILKSE